MTSSPYNVAAPIDGLPVDMLHEIFSHVLPADSTTIFIGNKAPTTSHINFPLNTLTEVSPVWENALKSSSSSIWARIILDLDNTQDDSAAIHHILEKVEKCVALSNNRRLSLAARGTTPLDAKIIAKALIHVMTTSAARLVFLRINCLMGPLNLELGNWAVQNRNRMNRLKVESFPILEQLQLLWGCEDSATHNYFPFEEAWREFQILNLFNNTPNLRGVVLDSLLPLFYSPNRAMAWSNIKQLKIVNIHSYMALLHYSSIFPYMPQLEILELVFIESSPGFESWPKERSGSTSYSFNNIRNLKITTFPRRQPQQQTSNNDYMFNAECILGILPYAPTLETIFLQRIPYDQSDSEFVKYNQSNAVLQFIEDPVMTYLQDSRCGFNIVQGGYYKSCPYYDVYGGINQSVSLAR